MQTDADVHPVPIKKILLALIPGLIAMLGLSDDAWSSRAWLGIVLLVGILIAGWAAGGKKLTDWTLMAGGLLVGIAQPVILGVLGVLAALATGTQASPSDSLSIAALPWIVIALLLYRLWRSGRGMSGIMLWGTAILLCCVLVRVKYIFLYGLTWPILGQALGISFWAAGTLLLPILLSGLMPRRFDPFPILFATGATYAWYQVLIDNGFRVSAGFESLGSHAAFPVYLILVRCLFIIVGPWLFLSLRERRWKLAGLSACMCASAGINILVSGLVRGDFSTLIWLSAIPYTISLGLSPLLADAASRGTDTIS
jgi:hypothetical protein